MQIPNERVVSTIVDCVAWLYNEVKACFDPITPEMDVRDRIPPTIDHTKQDRE